MNKILKNGPKTKELFEKLPHYFVIVKWARFVVVDVPYSGENSKSGIPLVWQYYDKNGEVDEFILIPITNITSGGVYCWNADKELAEKIAQKLNEGEEI